MENNSQYPTIDQEFLNEIKGNFNSILYLLTESIALNLTLSQVLLKKEVLTSEEFKHIFKVTGDKEALTHVYNELFGRFVNYYGSVMQTIKDGSYDGVASSVATTDEPVTSDSPAENFVNSEKSKDDS